MIRVGLVFAFADRGWLGGVSYFRNLLQAVLQAKAQRVEPVLIVGEDTPRELLEAFPAVEVLRTPLIDQRSMPWAFRQLVRAAAARDLVLERFLRDHRIEVLSHSPHLGRNAAVPTLGWIPDFQHRHLPALFSPEERARRDKVFLQLCRYCSSLVFSSQQAAQDLGEFAPQFVHKARVLHFASGFPSTMEPTPRDQLEQRYGPIGRYFLLPAQFWPHKNHMVVVEALAALGECGVTVLATGEKRDLNQSEHFGKVLARAAALGVERRFKALGVVPLQDLYGLMLQSVAIINPSLFEGWSTTVEEAKALGKLLLLSDIPVHREQAPARVAYFTADSGDQLAAALRSALESFDEAADRQHLARARATFSERVSLFGEHYQRLVEEVLDYRGAPPLPSPLVREGSTSSPPPPSPLVGEGGVRGGFRGQRHP